MSPYSWTYPGGVTRHIEALAAELRRARPRRAHPRAVRPRRRARAASAPGRRPQRLEPPERLRLARAHGRVPGQRRRLEPRGAPSPWCSRCAASCATAATTSCTCTSRSCRWSAGTRSAAPDDLPLVGTFHTYSENALTNGIAAVPARRAAAHEPPARAHRRLRGRRLDRAALLTAGATGSCPTACTSRAGATATRRLRRPPLVARWGGVAVARARFAVGEATRRWPRRRRVAAAHPVHRSGRRAQGPARAAARVRGAARARARDAHARRGVAGGGRAHDARRPRRARARQGLRVRASWPSSRRADVLLRAVAARRELRHGAHRGVRRGHAGGGLGHPRLPRRRARRGRRAAHAARRRARAGRGAARGSRSTRRRRGGWPPPPASAPSASPGRTSPPRCSTATSRRSRSGGPRPRLARGLRSGVGSRPPTCCRGSPPSGCPASRPARRAPATPSGARRVRALRRARRCAGSSLAGRPALAALALSASASGAWPRASLASSPGLLAAGLALMCASMFVRGARLARDPRRRPDLAHAPNVATRCRARSSAC